MTSTNLEFPIKRDIGKIIGDSFRFLFGHFGSLLTAFLIYVGPFILMGAFFQFQFKSVLDPTSVFLAQYTFGFVAMYVCILAGYIVLAGLTYASVMKYMEEEEGRPGDGIFPYLRLTLPRILSITGAYLLLIIAAVVVFGLLATITDLTVVVVLAFLITPFIIYLTVPLSIAQAVYVFEDVDVLDAVNKGFRLVQGHWWETFALILVQSILVSIIAGVATIPFYIIIFIKAFGEGGEFFMDPTNNLIGAMYLVSAIFSLFLAYYQGTGLIMQYFNLREKVFGISLKARIESYGHEA